MYTCYVISWLVRFSLLSTKYVQTLLTIVAVQCKHTKTRQKCCTLSLPSRKSEETFTWTIETRRQSNTAEHKQEHACSSTHINTASDIIPICVSRRVGTLAFKHIHSSRWYLPLPSFNWIRCRSICLCVCAHSPLISCTQYGEKWILWWSCHRTDVSPH